MYRLIKRIYLDTYFYLFPILRLRKSGAKVGKDVFLGKWTSFELENARLITIEDKVIISAHCKLIPHDSSLNNITGFAVQYGEIVLKKGCYIGANTTILMNSEVGENTIVGANSLVKGKLKPNSVYLGNPVRYYCSISELEKKWKTKEN